MPYKVIGNKVYHQKGGTWKVKQTCGSNDAAKKAMKLLYGIETGSIKKPRSKTSRSKTPRSKSTKKRR